MINMTRSLYAQSPGGFWAAALAATIWILNVGLDLFTNSGEVLGGLIVPFTMFWLVWVVLWYYLRDQENPLCFLGNLCLLMAMSGFVMWGLAVQLGNLEFLARYQILPIIGPCMGVLGTGLLLLGMQVNQRLQHTSPIVRRRDSTII